jgi:transcriptional regulator with XRE-family HTH domain
MPSTKAQPQNLRGARELQGLTLRQAAELAELDIGHLSRVERGLEGLSVPALHRLAGVLGLRELERMLGAVQRQEMNAVDKPRRQGRAPRR